MKDEPMVAPGIAPDPGAARARAEALLAELRAEARSVVVREARELLLTLRNQREFEWLCRLAEAVGRIDPADARTRRLYAQGLIETGSATAAIDMLRQLLARLPAGHGEWAEAWGLLGRAHKQIFFDAGAAESLGARHALSDAVEAYRRPYESRPTEHLWHGVNLLALVSRARLEGWIEIAPDLEPVQLAAQLDTALEAVPAQRRDEWYLPTLAEVRLGRSLAEGSLEPVEELLRRYLNLEGLQAFQVASTLRQFTEVWALDRIDARTPGIGLRPADLPRARGLLDVLRARLLQLPGGELRLPAASPETLDASHPAHGLSATAGQLEAILGADGPRTFAWWLAGVEAARSVGAVRRRLAGRIGTGFVVRAGDLGLAASGQQAQADELLFLTNFHVINDEGLSPGLRPQDAEIVFEAAEPGTPCGVAQVLWSSGVGQHDATLVRLDRMPAGMRALRIARELPPLPAPQDKLRPRVYVIGYPGGRELSVSMQDNELLDHEGPPQGKPATPAVWRVHYQAPTEGGNSGSPVFDDRDWSVIALHHSGGKFGMPRLNGQAGSYAANEGLAMATLAAAVSAELGKPA